VIRELFPEAVNDNIRLVASEAYCTPMDVEVIKLEDPAYLTAISLYCVYNKVHIHKAVQARLKSFPQTFFVRAFNI
jgi:hypothetical protein